jgi:hypothetical protein
MRYFGLYVQAIGGRRNAVYPLGIHDLDFLRPDKRRATNTSAWSWRSRSTRLRAGERL